MIVSLDDALNKVARPMRETNVSVSTTTVAMQKM